MRCVRCDCFQLRKDRDCYAKSRFIICDCFHCDVFVCGNDPAARATVVELVIKAGMKGWQAGRIENSAVSEAMTSALIFINRHYKIDGAGIRVTGTPLATETN